MISPLLRCIARSPTEWGLVLALVRGSISHPEASKVALSLVEKILGGQSGPGVTADNFSGLVSILSDFAGFGGVSAAGRQQRGRRPTASGVTLVPLPPFLSDLFQSFADLNALLPPLAGSLP